MSKNHAEEIAKMLGVEIGEEFSIKGYATSYKLTEGCFVEYKDFDEWHDDLDNYHFLSLLRGHYEVVKKPWKPERLEEFFYVDVDGEICNTEYNAWYMDIMCCRLGNCYRTKEEITPEVIAQWMDFYASDEVVDVFKKEGD